MAHQLACAKPGASHSEPVPPASCEGVCCPFVATSQHHCFLSPCFSQYLFSLPNTSSLSVACRSSKNSPCLAQRGTAYHFASKRDVASATKVLKSGKVLEKKKYTKKQQLQWEMTLRNKCTTLPWQPEYLHGTWCFENIKRLCFK